MSDFNECTFTGRLGADPDVKTTQRGDKVVNLRLAVSDQWKDKATGERRERTTWVPVVIFSEGLVRVAEQYLRKGSRILVRGAFSTREWEASDGSKRYATEIVLQGFDAKLTMLDGPPRDEAKPSAGRSRGSAPAPSPINDMDDEIPF